MWRRGAGAAGAAAPAPTRRDRSRSPSGSPPRSPGASGGSDGGRGGGDEDDDGDDGRAGRGAAGGAATAGGHSWGHRYVARKPIDGTAAQIAEPPSDGANAILFRHLCLALERATAQGKADRKLDIVFTPDILALRETQTVFPLMRLVLPQLDRERNTYGLKAASIAKMYVQVLNLSRHSPDAQSLLNWRDPTKGNFGASSAVGDFAAILEKVLAPRCPSSTDTTVRDVNELLDQLYAAVDNAQRKAVFVELVDKYSANEQKWICRIILKDLKCGLRHERVLKFYHPDAMDMYNACTNLRLVMSDPTIRDPRKRSKQEIQLMTSFKPMLCKRKSWQPGEQIMGRSTFFIEDKLDGERMLLHKKGQEVMVFSRNNNNYSEYAAIMQPYINTNVDCEDCILDGEMMAWDNDEERFIDFGHNRTVVQAEQVGTNATRHMCYVVFDVLWISGCPRLPEASGLITEWPLEKRKMALETVIRPIAHRLEVLPYQIVCADNQKKRLDTILERFHHAIDERYEGIVIKEAGSPYLYSQRDVRWVKLKPDYMEGMNDTLDLLIVGGYWGEGRRRAKQVSHFLMAVSVKDNPDDPTAKPSRFLVFCKVGSGYNRDELTQLQSRLRSHWKLVNKERPVMPDFMSGWKPGKRDDIPDVVIDDPANSIILELKGAEITVTDQFNAAYTLRFPRVESIRLDKDWNECTSMQEIYTFVTERRGKLGRAKGTAGATGSKSSRRTAARGGAALGRNAPVTVMSQYQGADLADVKEEGHVFAGKEFTVTVDDYAPFETSKAKLEKMIHANGGSIVQNPLPTTHYIIAAGETGLKSRNLIRANVHDLIRPTWVFDCAEEQTLIDIEPRYLVHMSPATAQALSATFDEFGDHYIRPTNNEELKLSLQQVSRKRKLAPMTYEQLEAAMTSADFEDVRTKYMLLSSCRVWFPDLQIDATKDPQAERQRALVSGLGTTRAMVRLYGATVTSTMDDQVTHIIAAELPAELLSDLQASGISAELVTPAWVIACTHANRIMRAADGYAPRVVY